MAQPEEHENEPVETRRHRRIWPAVVSGVVFLGVAGYYSGFVERVGMRLFGPPRVIMQEAYADEDGTTTFDHSLFDRLLRGAVDEDGWVDYEGLRRDPSDLDQYIETLAAAPFDDLGRDEKLAFLINAYNAFTLRLILDYYPLQSIRDIPADKRWIDVRWRVGSRTWSLEQIEHEQIRPKFVEPRIHFALVCAAVGCPPLRNEAYTGDKLDQQLTGQLEYAHRHERWFRFEPDLGRVYLTSLYNWYAGDFEQAAGSALRFAARYAPDLKAAIDADKSPSVAFLDYDWSLNSKKNAR